MRRAISVMLFFHVLLAAGSALAQSDVLYPGQVLVPGQHLRAGGCYNVLAMQPDGNLVARNNGPGGNAIWSSETDGSGAAYAIMQTDGNLVLYRNNGVAVWSTHTAGFPGSLAVIQDDGNFVVYAPGGFAIWDSGSDGEAIANNFCPASAKTEVEAGYDRPGSDYAAYLLGGTPHWSRCAKLCQDQARCKAFTYVPPGVQGAQARCYLKDPKPGRVARAGMVSGYVRRYAQYNW